MSDFYRYMHVERFAHSEVTGINIGLCHIFPKLDGTNSSIWVEDGEVHCGSRKRHLSLTDDNAGFAGYVYQNEPLQVFMKEHPTWRLFGEWLVPHTLKSYREDAWRRFYIFDVVECSPHTKTSTVVGGQVPPDIAKEIVDAVEGEVIQVEHIDQVREMRYRGGPPRFLPYEKYMPVLKAAGLDYVPLQATAYNASRDQLYVLAETNEYMMQPGYIGEGIVIKNYDFVNKYGRTVWAKIVRSEFKDAHHEEMGAPTIKGKDMIEEGIAVEFVTKALVDKERAKIEYDMDAEAARSGKMPPIQPRLLGMVWHCILTEDIPDFVKKNKGPTTIDFKLLRRFVTNQIKTHAPDVFGG